MIFRFLGVAALLYAAGAPAAAEAPPRIPAAVFAEKPFIDGPLLSPDGNRILARMQVQGEERLGIYELATQQFTTFSIPKGNDLHRYQWAGNDRVLISVLHRTGIYGTEVRATRLLGYHIPSGKIRFIGPSDMGLYAHDVLWVDPAGEYILLSLAKKLFSGEMVYKIRLEDNQTEVVERPFDGVYSWYADNAGVVRAGLGYTQKGWFVVYRSRPGDPLRPVAKGYAKLNEAVPTGAMTFIKSGTDEGYIFSNKETGRFALHKFNFLTRQIGEKIYENPTNDLAGLDFDAKGEKLEAVHYVDDRPRTAWLDPALKEVQTAIDAALQNRQNRIVSRSRDNDRMLVHTGTSNDLGSYYLFQLSSAKLSRIAKLSDKLSSRQLAPMEPITYRARDGLNIPGYVTYPVGRARKGLPLIVMPHGGPYPRQVGLRRTGPVPRKSRICRSPAKLSRLGQLWPRLS